MAGLSNWARMFMPKSVVPVLWLSGDSIREIARMPCPTLENDEKIIHSSKNLWKLTF